MEIDQHNISFSTTHSKSEKHTKKETFVFATRNGRQRVQRTTDGEGNTEVQRQSHIQPDRVEVSEEGKEASESEKSGESSEFELTVQQKMELKLIHKSFEQILEGNFEFLDPEEFLEDLEKAKEGKLTEGEDGEIKDPNDVPEEQAREAEGEDFGFSYDYEETYYESEKLTFKADGKVKTADGEEISFNLDLNISREFFQKTSVSIQGGNARLLDPLVVNFEGKAAELSSEKFSFDLDTDGVEEEISKLESGSGFLALDENENGEIDDGSELFGAETGKGFEELAEHDKDKDRFIDEGDPVFDDLMLMTSGQSGEKSLISLEEAGVGAIFLGSADTEFSYKSKEDNELQGQLARTGVFIGEDGNVGSVQKINLATDSAESTTQQTESTSDTTTEQESAQQDSPENTEESQSLISDGFGPPRGRALGPRGLSPRFSTDSLPTPPSVMPTNSVLNGFSGPSALSGLNLRV